MNKDKITLFANDPLLMDAVKACIMETFLKRRGERDVQTLAAERLAVEFLDEAWDNILGYRKNEDKKKVEPGNVGL